MDQKLLNNIILYGGGFWAFIVLLMLVAKLYVLYLSSKIERLSESAPSHEREMLEQKQERARFLYSRIIFIVLGGAVILLFVVIIKALSDPDDDDSSDPDSGSWFASLIDYSDDSSSTSSGKKQDKPKKKQPADENEYAGES